jgi:L-asparaginase
MEIVFITTGGTIDKVYFDAKSSYEIGEPQIPKILEKINAAFEHQIIALLRKDSLEMTDADRQLIRDTVARQDSRYIVITHGTDTMVDTAKALADIEDKVIVLTGALNPARFADSDAVFNIGCAIGAVQRKTPGVFIAMNGRVWHPEEVRKNRNANRFEAL